MKDLGKVVCHIPARGGSKRVPAKNLRFLAGKPMLSYAIETAKQAGVFQDIYVNTDSPEIAALAESHGVKVYIRDGFLASDQAKGDDFTADFMKHVEVDTLLMVSPVCPLVSVEDIRAALRAFANSDCDTLISCEETKMQTFCEGKAVNINASEPLAPSQENPTIQVLNWAVTIWDTPTFLTNYEHNSTGYLGTNRLLFPIAKTRSAKVSVEGDFLLAEKLILAQRMGNEESKEPEYWEPSNS